MPAMAQSRGMTKRSRLLICLLAMLLLMSGCSADILRPDLFHDSDMRPFPHYMYDTDENSGGGDSEDRVKQGPQVEVWPNGTSHHDSNYNYTTPSRVDNTDKFAGLPAETVTCSDYSDYLRTEVYDKIMRIVANLDDDTKSKLYVRCGHTGYDMDSSGNMRRKTGWQDYYCGESLGQMVGGADAMMLLAQAWLGPVADNDAYIQQQIAKAQRDISDAAKPEDWSKSWYGLGDTAIPQIYKNLMGRDGANFSTLQEYYDAIATDPYHNIPNFSFQIRTSETSFDTVTFNSTSSSLAEQYKSGVSTDTIVKMFRTQNQYSNRNREPTHELRQVDSAMVKYYIDGYNKTAIFIACEDGTNLRDLLGDKYDDIYNIINDSANCTDVSAVRSVVPEKVWDDNQMIYYDVGYDYSGAQTIPGGTKGVD